MLRTWKTYVGTLRGILMNGVEPDQWRVCPLFFVEVFFGTVWEIRESPLFCGFGLSPRFPLSLDGLPDETIGVG